MTSSYYNANPPKRRNAKKKSAPTFISDIDQLRSIMSKFDDPLSEVISILDPYHNKIVRPEVKSNPNIPVDPNYGLFRVIYWIRDDDGVKFHTSVVKAKDGFDARADVEGEFIEEYKSNNMKVVGVECVIVPKKYIWKINEEYPLDDQQGIMKTQADLEGDGIIKKLEEFEDGKPAPDLSKFIDDE